MKTINCLLAIAILFFCANSVNAQNPITRMVPYATIDDYGDEVSDFKLINYNNDEYLDYYMVFKSPWTTTYSRLFDGRTGESLWHSPTSSCYKSDQDIGFIDSLGIWRNFILGTTDYQDFYITWCDLPDSEIAPDSIIGFNQIYHNYNGYWFSNIEVFPVIYQNHCAVIAELCTGLTLDRFGGHYFWGSGYIFDVNQHNQLSGFDCARPFNNRIFAYNGNKYFCHTGDYYNIDIGDFPGEDTTFSIYESTIIYRVNGGRPVISYTTFESLIDCQDIFQAEEQEPPKQLLSANNRIKIYDSVFDSNSCLTLEHNLGVTFPKFIKYYGELKVFVATQNGRFEILNPDLTLYRPIPDTIREDVFNVYAEDLDHDGTSEIICMANGPIKIYKLEESVDVNDNKAPLPRFAISNYPNPFNPSTTIKYNLPTEAQVKLEIYDILGRQIATLEDGQKPAGYHQIVWDASDMSSGVYFYKLTAGNYNETRRMMLVK